MPTGPWHYHDEQYTITMDKAGSTTGPLTAKAELPRRLGAEVGGLVVPVKVTARAVLTAGEGHNAQVNNSLLSTSATICHPKQGL